MLGDLIEVIADKLYLRLNLSHLKGFQLIKAKVKCEKISVVPRKSNPGPLALATSALVTELRQLTTSNT